MCHGVAKKPDLINNILNVLLFFSNYYLEGMTAMAALKKAEEDFNERNKK